MAKEPTKREIQAENERLKRRLMEVERTPKVDTSEVYQPLDAQLIADFTANQKQALVNHPTIAQALKRLFAFSPQYKRQTQRKQFQSAKAAAVDAILSEVKRQTGQSWQLCSINVFNRDPDNSKPTPRDAIVFSMKHRVRTKSRIKNSRYGHFTNPPMRDWTIRTVQISAYHLNV